MELNNYRAGLSAQELKVLEIAESHLQSSFDLERSIGYLEHRTKSNEAQKQTQECTVKGKSKKKKLIISK